MNKFLILLPLLCIGFITNGQEYSELVADVDTISLGGAPGTILIHDQDVISLISNIECDTTDNTPVIVATTHGLGKVIGIGHPGAVRNESFDDADNTHFFKNALDWFSPNGGKIGWSFGWGNPTTGSEYVDFFESELNFSSTSFNSQYTLENLQQYDVLILGDDRTYLDGMNQSQLDAIKSFVNQGGSLIICGVVHGWPNDLAIYPMNQIADLFGFEFSDGYILRPPLADGNPLFFDVFPDSDITDYIRKCFTPFEFYDSYIPRGDTLRIIKLAIAVSGRYTEESGGKDAVIEIQKSWLKEINETYGREYCVRFELVSQYKDLIFEKEATDLWTDPGPNTALWCGHFLDSIDYKLTNFLGHSDYDIVHFIVSEAANGGCGGDFRGGGVSGGFDIPITRHELGHQFGQPHSIQYVDAINYEPENGSFSIQGGNRFPYAHATSYHYAARTLETIEKNTGSKLATDNTIPDANAGPDYVIPIRTPYVLIASGSDPDLGDTLTYIWDNMDKDFMKTLPTEKDATGCLFVRTLPRKNNFRNFPSIEDHINNVLDGPSSQLPSQARTMNLRLTVNDNHRIVYNGELIAASGINFDNLTLTVDASGPFEITSQSAPEFYQKLEEVEVNWTVNGTDLPPIATEFVRISISIDGGFTFDEVLVESTENDGSTLVIMPDLDIEKARIKVEAIGNIYYSINKAEIQIGGNDLDGDGFTEFNDCDDENPNISPAAIEKLNNEADEDCNQLYAYSSVLEMDFTQLFENVDSIWAGESGSIIEILSDNVVPIIAGDNCLFEFSTLMGVGALYGKGRVIGLGQENFVTDRGIDVFDNLQFIINSCNWLNQEQDKVVGLVNGFFITSASLKLKYILEDNGFTVRYITTYYDKQTFNGIDLIIDLNNWRDLTNVVSQDEIDYFTEFIEQGGGALLAGSAFGWPFPQEYTMNQLSEVIGFRWTEERLLFQDNIHDNFPYLKNFYPTSRPICSELDEDNDGYYSDEDCDDTNPNINPGAVEIAYNGIDDDCNAATRDDDLDLDGFLVSEDCDDLNSEVNPYALEVVYNGLDDDCDLITLDDDLDMDGFLLEIDCNDTIPTINPDAIEIPNNGIDENCDGYDFIVLSTKNKQDIVVNIYPNPADQYIYLKVENLIDFEIRIYDLKMKTVYMSTNQSKVYVGDLPAGFYFIKILSQDKESEFIRGIIVTH